MNQSAAERSTKQSEMQVTLREVTRDNWTEAFDLSVKPDQLRFIAEGTPPVAIALAKAYIRPSGIPAVPYAIYSGPEMVGFFNLVYEPGSVDNYWIFHYFIDQRFQGRGLGTAGLDALVRLLKADYPACESLALTVDPENHAAERLYRRFGFQATGEVAFGEPVHRLSIDRISVPE
jgi:diamine N-acetyltransferase